MKRRDLALGIAGVLILTAAYLLFWPAPIDAAAWSPPPAPALRGVYQQNSGLSGMMDLAPLPGVGPEAVAFDSQGRIYTGLEDGRIVRLDPDGTHVEVFSEVPGRPLGLDFDLNGNLLVAAGDAGLLVVTPDGSLSTLVTSENGVPFRLVNDVVAARNGLIYFSDSSNRFGPERSFYDLMEHRPNGRLLVYDPESGEAQRLLGDLYYPNGIAISPDHTYLLIVETSRYRVLRYYLGGGLAGQLEVFIDNLPGFPDGISTAGENLFWLALASPRKENVDQVLLPRPFLREIIMRLPDAAIPDPENYGFVLGLSNQGEVVHNLQDPSGSYIQISSVIQHEGFLYVGSIAEDALGRLPAP